MGVFILIVLTIYLIFATSGIPDDSYITEPINLDAIDNLVDPEFVARVTGAGIKQEELSSQAEAHLEHEQRNFPMLPDCKPDFPFADRNQGQENTNSLEGNYNHELHFSNDRFFPEPYAEELDNSWEPGFLAELLRLRDRPMNHAGCATV